MIDQLLDEHLDMVVGLRVDQSQAAYRRGHRIGNRLFTGFLASTFGHTFKDILSGYRVFSRRFVKSFPVLSGGFEIETEFAVYALELSLPVAEVGTPYYARPEGSFSKLNTWQDGLRIFNTMLKLNRLERPLRFFSAIGIVFALLSIAFGLPVVITFLENRPGTAPADRRAFHGSDDHGAAFGFVGARARHRDARAAGNEDARLPVPTTARAELKLPRGPGAIVWTAALQGDIPPTR
ncbi:hypothetical protein ACVWZ6_003503 [Bradyrhizobium sp. GM6.1]